MMLDLFISVCLRYILMQFSKQCGIQWCFQRQAHKEKSHLIIKLYFNAAELQSIDFGSVANVVLKCVQYMT